MAGLSKVAITCRDYHHPWTDKCVNAAAGLLLSAIPYCLRVYTIVYLLSLLMRHRIPKLNDLKRTILGILQSSAFLVTNAYTFVLFNCTFRKLLGTYYFSTVAFVPCIFASITAILVERPERRPLLTLYVANVATEALWNMSVARGLVRSVPHGQILIFGMSISILLYLYRLGMHKNRTKDSIFNILRLFVGKEEEGPIRQQEESSSSSEMQTVEDNATGSSRSRPKINLTTITGYVALYSHLINAKHKSCAHQQSCLRYAILGSMRPFIGGVGLQVVLKLLVNVKKIAQGTMKWKSQIFNQKILRLGMFLGSFSFLYKAISCTLRHSFGYDDALFAIPAGLISSITFRYYSDVTVALYVMWKMLQLVYNLGIEERILPHVPNFTIYLYALFTSVLFHAAILEPQSLRPSYFKFLHDISGGRLSRFKIKAFDDFGLDTYRQFDKTVNDLNLVETAKFPSFAFAS